MCVKAAEAQRARTDAAEHTLGLSRRAAQKQREETIIRRQASQAQVLHRQCETCAVPQLLPPASRALRRAARSAKNTRMAACGSPDANASA